MWKRGRCVKCGQWNEILYSFNGMRLDDKCLEDEQDKAGHEQKVQNIETSRMLVQGTQNVTDDIEAA